MGLGLIGAMAGAAEGIAGTANTYYRANLEEQKQQALQDAMMERQKRMAEFSVELQGKARKQEAEFKAEEAGKITTRAQELANQRGGGLMQSANTAYDSMAETDPEGAALGKQAVADAQSRGAYNQSITPKDRITAAAERDPAAIRDLVSMEAAEERGAREDKRIAIAEERQAAMDKLATDRVAAENRRIDAMISRGNAAKPVNDTKALKSFMDENKALWMQSDPVTGKQTENVYVSSFLRQAYSRGDTDSINGVINRARQASIDKETGQLDDEKFAANIAALSKAGLGRYSQPSGERVATAKPETMPAERPSKPKISAKDIGYSPGNQTQFEYVLDNISDPGLASQALSWLSDGALSIGQRQKVEKALKRAGVI